MQIRISLHNSGGELDWVKIDGTGDLESDSAAIQDALKDWTLAPGDTIKIEELP